MEEELEPIEFHVGDVVRINRDNERFLYTSTPSGLGISREMLRYADQVSRLTYQRRADRFYIDIDRGEWTWSPELFSKATDEETKQYLEERHDNRTRIDFEVGDLVRIRKVEDMKKQFRVDPDGDINCRRGFNTHMYGLEGMKAIIYHIDRDGDLALEFLNRKGKDTSFCFSTDMIEIVEKNYAKKIEEERKIRMERKKANEVVENDEELIKEMISKVDVAKVKKIIASSFQMKGTSLNGIDKMLENWAKAKKDLYLIFGKQLKLSKEIEYEADDNAWKEKRSKLAHEFPGTSFLLDHLDIRCFKDNTYRRFSSSWESEYTPYAKDGMKLSTYLSQAFKSNEFDIALSKTIDESKVKGVISVSIDPVDYLLMSVNKSGWQSCHSIHESSGKSFGCYVGRNIQLYV